MDHAPIAHDRRVVCLWHQDAKSAIFDPSSSAWTPLADPFGSSGVRGGAVVVSAGAELFVWGGAARSSFASRDFRLRDDGVRLGAGDSWKPVASQRAPSQRASAVQAWTGHEVLVWGGWKMGKPVKGGAAYDPSTDTWRKLPPRETLSDRRDSVWTGRELWLWDREERRGHAYDPRADRWRDLAALPETREHERAMVPCLDGVLFVCREGHFGSDLDGCVVWRYEPRADLWEPSAPPPAVRGGTPRLVDCGGRLVLGIAQHLFEYLPAKDAWAELPAPEMGHEAHLVWVDERLVAFGRTEARSIDLPATTTPLAATETPIVVAAAPSVTWPKGPAVTAIVIDDRTIIAGHEDGRVRRNGAELRKADGRRVVGLAARDGSWTCLAGDRLETRRASSSTATVVELGFSGHALAQDGGALVVAGEGALASFVWSSGWALARQVKTTGQTIHLALLGDTIARVVAGPERKKGERKEPRDTVELRDASTLKCRQELAPPFASTTVAAAPVPDGTIVAGLGGYRTERYPRGKKRAETAFHDSYFTRLATSRDGRWLLAAYRGVALHDLRDGRREIWFELDESVEPLAAIAIAEDASVIAFGTIDGAVYEIDRERLGVTVHPPEGAPIVLQPPASEVIERGEPRAPTEPDATTAASPDGQRGIHGWRRWHIRRDGEAKAHFLELLDQVAEIALLPRGGLVGRTRTTLLVMEDDGRLRSRFAGHGGDLVGLAVSPDGQHVTVWDQQSIVRRWRL
ncbi:MAG: hypothetical protein U0270_01950 [Labilithrix sp.]